MRIHFSFYSVPIKKAHQKLKRWRKTVSLPCSSSSLSCPLLLLLLPFIFQLIFLFAFILHKQTTCILFDGLSALMSRKWRGFLPALINLAVFLGIVKVKRRGRGWKRSNGSTKAFPLVIMSLTMVVMAST